ncbi:glycosyltransferase family 4 protein [Aromatoleum anaerobium]|uniref:Glycosyltransferase n=1 Tax=Aromatoleum anaerobium TaxID=182180 RepID=A0ABX1PJZ2_9RHOO|nr:glycosyltransferase family 4 protein [Aromatoleum anaerobium]MCK0507731.1 glycosyltransferase family 4 protein [Aromatoleum anaerobium]
MRIAHVVRQYHPSVGGMEDVVRNIARHQLASGFRPVIVTLDRLFRDREQPLPAQDEVDRVPVRRLSYAGSSRYPLCPQVLRLLGDADVVHVHGVDFFFDYLAATRWLHHRPLVASTHGGFFHTRFAASLKKVFFHTVTRGSVRGYDRIIATSDSDGRIFAPIVGNGRLQVIENGVNVGKFRACSASDPVPTLIYFGRWSENKGLPAALDLLARLRRTDPTWRLIVAGREYDYSVAALHALIAARNLAAAVEVVPNPGDTELAALIGRASYFICLSRHEGFGLAAIEAMSAGLVPVLSDIPPFRSLVERSQIGVVVESGREDEAVASLNREHHLPRERQRRRRERAIAFAEPYDWQHVAGCYLRVYREVERAT